MFAILFGLPGHLVVLSIVLAATNGNPFSASRHVWRELHRKQVLIAILNRGRIEFVLASCFNHHIATLVFGSNPLRLLRIDDKRGISPRTILRHSCHR